jgi:hypothetical protein
MMLVLHLRFILLKALFEALLTLFCHTRFSCVFCLVAWRRHGVLYRLRAA